MAYAWKVTGERVKLDEYNPGHHNGLDHVSSADELVKLTTRLGELQELLYAAQLHSVLIVLQGMDTSGKDGTISHVMSGVNPQGCRVISFKQPTTEELAHDFLWRVHPYAPGKGMIALFNRSYYEDVLVVRVHELVEKPIWQRRYDHISAFEQLLADNQTIILKFYLHISQKEQVERLQAREADVAKRWKLSPQDFSERHLWKDYQAAYEDALTRCASKAAPWYIVPADHKWFRNLAVAQALVDRLSEHEPAWKQALEARGERVYEVLKEQKALL